MYFDKGKKKLVLVSLAILLALFALYRFLTFNLFDEPNLELTEIIVPDREYKLRLFFVPSNAASQDYIQIRKIEGSSESVIGNYERYDTVVSHAITDNTLRLILRNTNSKGKMPDTVYLTLD